MRIHRLTSASVSAVVAASLVGCSNSSPTPPVPPDPTPVIVHANQATTLDLGGGADLIIPPGAITDGAKVSASYKGAPDGKWKTLKPTSTPVELRSDPPDAIHGLLTLEFPVPVDQIREGIDPADQFGISTFDPYTKTWVPFYSMYDAARHKVIAQIPHFSWWNPTTWDWVGIGASITQGIGELVGRRAGNATCHGRAPSWVSSIPGVTGDAGMPIRSCTQDTRGLLDVQIVNNRPYGQVLTYGSPVDFGWHAGGDSAADKLRNAVMDRLMTPKQLYLPPLSAASVGIMPLAANGSANFVIGPTKASVAADIIQLIASKAIDYVPEVGDCASYLVDVPFWNLGNMGAVRDLAVNAADCLRDLTKKAVEKRLLDKVKISQIESLAKGLRTGSIIGTGFTVYGAEWQVLDLFLDRSVFTSAIRNGFTVFAKAGPVAPTPTNPPPPATNPPLPASHPVNAYDNYGTANAGRAMCSGNPGRPESMPGGNASQTFSVPAGVRMLTGAKVQIDPNAAVTAHFTVSVNGAAAASTTAAAAGDTHFTFGPVSVAPGQTVKISITFTATSGKIITVYTAGAPGGTFVASNSCSDGAPNVNTSGTGLRAVVLGMS